MRKWSVGLLVAAFFHLGISASLGAAEVKKTVSPDQSSTKASKQLSAMTPQSVGDGIARMITRPKAAQSSKTSKTAAKPTAKANAAVSKAVPVTPSASGSRRSGYVPPPPKTAEPQIRQEIQRILDLDKKIKSLQLNRSAQLQRIQEQARIHQKILGELEASKKANTVSKPLEKDALLAQEKIRIIREETQRNSKMVDEIQKKSAGESAPQAAKEKPRAA